MSSALADWREHRVDYRLPGLLTLLLFVALGLVLPQDWLDLPWLGTPGVRYLDTREFQMAEEAGLQIIDVKILALAPAALPRSQPIAPEKVELVVEPDSSPEEFGGEGEFSWDPTHAYRGGEELLLPEASGAETRADETMRSLKFLLSLDGVESYTLSDTSHATLAHTNFTRLQRELFEKNAPIWAFEKASERYRDLYHRLIHSNPLRGPQ